MAEHHVTVERDTWMRCKSDGSRGLLMKGCTYDSRIYEEDPDLYRCIEQWKADIKRKLPAVGERDEKD